MRAARRSSPTPRQRRVPHLIVDLSGNEVLGRQIAQLQLPTLRSAYFRLFDATLQTASLAQHGEILEAILNSDANRAERTVLARSPNHRDRTAPAGRAVPRLSA